MAKKWVVNASPLIILGKLNRLPLLMKLADELVIPSAVAEEIRQGPNDDPARAWLDGSGSGSIREAGPVETVLEHWDLGAGESHVISWVLKNRGFEAIVDDLPARKCAAVLSVPVRGTLGILVLAKNSGLIEAVGPILDRIQGDGLRISEDVLEKARRLAGEQT